MKRWLRPKLKRQGSLIAQTTSLDFETTLLDGGEEMVGMKVEGKKDDEAKKEMPETGATMNESFEGEVCLINESPYMLHRLAASGQLKTFAKIYTEHPSKLRNRDSKGRLPIHHAATSNHSSIIDFIAQNTANTADLDEKDGDGQSALHCAVLAEATTAIEALLRNGADPNIKNARKMAPLHLGAERNKYSAVQALCCCDRTDKDVGGESGATALHYTAFFDSAESATVLLSHGARLCKPCDVGLYPMHIAAQNGASKTLQIFISAAQKMYKKPRDEYLKYESQEKSTPLHDAVNAGMIGIVKICLETSAKITSAMEDGSTPVHLAAAQGSLDILKLMFEMQPESKWEVIKARDGEQMTPLHKAALFDREEVINYLLDQGAEKNPVDNEGRTPLLLAACKRSWNAVNAMLSQKACIGIKDKENRNILHLIIQNGGKPDQFDLSFCSQSVKKLLDEADNMGCTPLHYASKHGMISTISDLIKMGAILNAKNNQKQSPLHFAAKYGRYNTCVKLLESNSGGPNAINEMDGMGHSPLDYAAAEGHVKVVKLLLARGAICNRNINGNTPLHLAAINGYTQCMRLLLNTNSHLLDGTNKVGDTPLHVASEAGSAKAVTLLMSCGAAFTHNHNKLNFLDMAIKTDNKDVCVTIISHDRWEEVVSMGSTIYGCPMVGFIKFMPEVCQMVLDRCRTSVGSPKSPEYHINYKFRYLQCGLRLFRSQASNPNNELMPLHNVNHIYNFEYMQVPIEDHSNHEISVHPLLSLNMMVRYNRVECLSHPVCIAFLNMKWHAYGMWLHVLNLIVYLIFLASLTSFVSLYDFGIADIDKHHPDTPNNSHNSSDGHFDPHNVKMTNAQTLLTAIILAFSVLNCVKEVAQMIQQKWKYFLDPSNLLEWILYISTGVFIAPFFAGYAMSLQWQFGAVAVFLAWFNLLLFLRRFDFFGIYVVMFLEILSTLVQVLVVFSVLIVAFGMAFYILLCGQSTAYGHRNPWLSVSSTIVMMMGSMEYIDNWVLPYVEQTHSYPALSFLMLIMFILFMPILLINLLIGLAVGDIEAVQRDARLKRLAMQVEIHTDWERKLPIRLLEMVDKTEHKVYPNCRARCWNRLWSKMNDGGGLYNTQSEGEEGKHAAEENADIENQAYLFQELSKQKKRLRYVSSDLSKHYELLRLIVQKMEIHTEADDIDEDTENDADKPNSGSQVRAIGWSSPALRNSLLKQASVVKAWQKGTNKQDCNKQ